MDTRACAGTFECRNTRTLKTRTLKLGTTARAALALLAVIFAFSARAADEPAKAPPGSNDRAIWVSSYCLGQATARVAKLNDLFVANAQQVKGLQTQQSEPDPANRNTKINQLEISALYLAAKMTFLASEAQWLYKLAVDLGRQVEDPDPQILKDGMGRGTIGGNFLFSAESRCQSACAAAKDAAEFGRCVDSCADQADHTLFGAAQECDRLYANRSK